MKGERERKRAVEAGRGREGVWAVGGWGETGRGHWQGMQRETVNEGVIKEREEKFGGITRGGIC